jgi:hypothetical protein
MSLFSSLAQNPTGNRPRKSRKELRKRDRTQKKQLRQQHYATAVDEGKDTARRATKKRKAESGAEKAAKRAKTSAPSDAKPSNFMALLQSQGLIKGSGTHNPFMDSNNDDAEIAYYERLLKKSKPLAADDGLDYVLGFMDDVQKGGRKGDDDAATEEFDDDDAEIDLRPTSRHIPTGKTDEDDGVWEDDTDDTDEGDVDDDDDDDEEDEEGSDDENGGGGGGNFNDAMDMLDDFENGSEDQGSDGESASDDDESGSESGDAESDNGSDSDSSKEEKPKEAKTLYITRANAFGDNVPGGSRTGRWGRVVLARI